MIAEELFKQFFPYCIQRLKSGGWIVLNRRYKPLGQPGHAWVDYESHPSAVKFARMSIATARKLSWKPIPDDKVPETIHLYKGSLTPDDPGMSEYLERLARLAKIKATPLS